MQSTVPTDSSPEALFNLEHFRTISDMSSVFDEGEQLATGNLGEHYINHDCSPCSYTLHFFCTCHPLDLSYSEEQLIQEQLHPEQSTGSTDSSCSSPELSFNPEDFRTVSGTSSIFDKGEQTTVNLGKLLYCIIGACNPCTYTLYIVHRKSFMRSGWFPTLI